MKTKISGAVIALFFLMACGSSDQPKEEEKQPEVVAPSKKFVIKAHNMMYVVINSDSVLVANQADPTKAEVFEKIDQGNGKFALRASTGRYVSNNQANSFVVDVIRNTPSDWEQFELIALDQTTANIKASSGKYISADLASTNILYGNKDIASDWETFTLEEK